VWKTQPIPLLFVSNVIIGDFDGDGKTEMAITPWYDVWVLDAETGELKYKSSFKHPGAESGRAYGWFGAHDIDGDEKQELIILSDFENHIAVPGWNNGTLEMKRSKLIERGIVRKNTIFSPGAYPVRDIDGDGILF
jgi:hypothetical protein